MILLGVEIGTTSLKMGIYSKKTQGLVKSLCEYQSKHLIEVLEKVILQNKVFITGGGIDEVIIRAKKK